MVRSFFYIFLMVKTVFSLVYATFFMAKPLIFHHFPSIGFIAQAVVVSAPGLRRKLAPIGALGGARGRAQPFATAAGNSSEGPAGTAGKRINFWMVVWNHGIL